MPVQFRIRESAVASEIIDGEAIIMQLRTGHYFSARGSAAAIWSLFTHGVDLPTISRLLAEATGAGIDDVRVGVEAFAADAQHHALGSVQEAIGAGVAGDLPVLPTRWETPVLEVFSDMQDLLLLDPIHDVSDEAGWPMQKPVA